MVAGAGLGFRGLGFWGFRGFGSGLGSSSLWLCWGFGFTLKPFGLGPGAGGWLWDLALAFKKVYKVTVRFWVADLCLRGLRFRVGFWVGVQLYRFCFRALKRSNATGVSLGESSFQGTSSIAGSSRAGMPHFDEGSAYAGP